MRITLFALALCVLIPLSAVADDQPPQVKVAALEKTPIAAGPLKIRITKLKASFLKLGNGSIEVEVENASTGFETFFPQRLALVDKNNTQVNVMASRRTYYRALPPYDPNIPTTSLDRRIAPGARVRESYGLSGKVHFPLRLYYNEKLLASIVE